MWLNASENGEDSERFPARVNAKHTQENCFEKKTMLIQSDKGLFLTSLKIHYRFGC